MRRWTVLCAMVLANCGGTIPAPSTPDPKVTEVVQSAWQRTPPPPLSRTRRATVDRPQVSDSVLPNGLRVVVVENHRQPIVSVRLVFGQGSTSDPSESIGSTFFAISLLAGYYEVNKDDLPIIEADSFAREVFYTGGKVELAVNADHAYFGIDGYSKDFERYLKMLSTAIRAPRCGPKSFVVRRNAMIHSLEEVELSDQRVFSLFLNRAAFGAGHPYARPVFGTMASLKRLERWQIQERQQNLLKPRGSTLLVVGDINPRTVMTALRSTLARWTSPRTGKAHRTRIPGVRPHHRSLLIPRRPAASMVLCATRPLSDLQVERPVMEVLVEVLGGGIDSRLGTSLRTQTGLSYSSHAALLRKRHAEALVACTQVRADDTSAALRILRDVFLKMTAEPPSATELARAKARLHAIADERHASTLDIMNHWLKALELGLNEPEDDRRFAEVTGAQVHALAQRVLAAETVRFVLGGPSDAARSAAQTAGLADIRTARLDL